MALSFYDQLPTTGEFEQTLSNPPNGVLHRVAPQPVSTLHFVDGALQLTTTVVEGLANVPGSTTVGLDECTVGTSDCSGVYPVVVNLENAAGTVVSHFTTYLTYAETKSTNPLVFSWVASVGSQVRLRTTGPLSSALGAPSPSRVNDIAQLLATLAANPTVAESVAPSPAIGRGRGRAPNRQKPCRPKSLAVVRGDEPPAAPPPVLRADQPLFAQRRRARWPDHGDQRSDGAGVEHLHRPRSTDSPRPTNP